MRIIDQQREQHDRLPCAHWCRICEDIAKHPLHPDSRTACDDCPDCNINLAAADDATWD